MNEESPNPSAKETFEQLEVRRRKAEVELYEGYVRGQVQRMENENQFQEAFQRERIRQAQRFSNIAVVLLIIDAFCLSAIVAFCFIAVPYLHLPLFSVIQIGGVAATTVGVIFGIARWLYNKPNRFLEVAAGNLSPQDNETLSSKFAAILGSRSKYKGRLGKNTVSTNATVLPNSGSLVNTGSSVTKQVKRQKNSNNLQSVNAVASTRPRCPICKQNKSVRRRSSRNGYPVYICTRCNKTFDR